MEMNIELVVSTDPFFIQNSQIGSFPRVGVKIKIFENPHPEIDDISSTNKKKTNLRPGTGILTHQIFLGETNWLFFWYTFPLYPLR